MEVTTWVTATSAAMGPARAFERAVRPRAIRYVTILRRFTRRFPELDAALWNPTRELGESIEVVVNDAVLGVHHELDSPLEGGERIMLLGQFMGGLLTS